MKVLKRELLLEEIKGHREVACRLLEADHPLFVKQSLYQEDEVLMVVGEPPENAYGWEELATKTIVERLKHVLTLGHLFTELEDSLYTYVFSPEHVLFTLNALPLLTTRGIKGQVMPYEGMTEADFLQHYQAMIIALLDDKVTYDSLVEGKLPFYRGNLFCEKVARVETLSAVQELLQEHYQEEKRLQEETMTLVTKSSLSRFKGLSLAASVLAGMLAAGLFYLLVFALPRQEMISQIRLSFIQDNYSAVLTTVKGVDSRSLSQEDKYIVAYSVIMTEPLTDKQRDELRKMSPQSNEDYLRYWVLIGQAKIDEAIDIASYLDDPQLLMYGMTKKIDELQRDPSLTAEERTNQIKAYKTRLDDLKKTYLVLDETGDDDGRDTETVSDKEK